MMVATMLLTNVVAPLPIWGWNDSLTDGASQKFTKGWEIQEEICHGSV